MRYEILCPLRVVDGSSITSLSARKIEVLLAALLVRVDEAVSSEELMKEIWGTRAPRQAIATLHVYISQLRKFLRRPGRAESPIVTARSGYVLRLGADELDFHVFQELVRQGRAARRAGLTQDACEAYEEGLGLWRGPVLEDLRDGAIVNGFVCWAEQAWLECVEAFVDAGLELGRHREFVSFLYARIEELPLHEAFYRQLMLALYRSGCRADALSVYQSARTVLSEELGLEPSATLKRLHQAVLVDAPELEAA
ncbi:AfsR/SARP family transcriptional regulator [Streptomyces sparsogenes]|uniref:AfsR/SARP family transcriptional regulator n=1 Tax=Streptomyces sparsogenes TaxID=67365 RepID=UPI0033E7BB42